MQVVILAGGKGTRLKERTAALPKPMVEVGGKPLIEHQILLARKHGFTDFLLLTGFGSDHIEQYFGNGSRWSVRVRYRRDPRPLGTAGAVLNAFSEINDTFFVLYGDTILNVDLGRMARAHSNGTSATLLLHPNDHPHDSDLVELDAGNRIIAFHSYPHPPDRYFANLVNAALYVISKESLRDWHSSMNSATEPLDFAKHVFPAMARSGAVLRGYRSREYIRDAGTPPRLDRVRSDYGAGRIQNRSFETPLPAVFLDRDGTLNVDKCWLSCPSQVELLPGAAASVRAINESGRLAVVITNQPVIARGECSEAQLAQIHNRLEWLLGESHAYVDAIYYCPHHPDKGFPGERSDLKFACDCRKPATGLFELAAKELNIDRSRSWMIGDSAADIEAARRFGMPCAFLTTSQHAHSSLPFKPDAEFSTLAEATKFVLSR